MNKHEYEKEFSKLSSEQGSNDNKTFWDSLSHIYTEHYTKPPVQEFMDRMIPELNPNDNIFEYGCSSGMNLDYLKSKGFDNVHGVDISKVAIDEGKKRFNNIDISVSDYTTDMDLEPEVYDIVFSRAVLQHVNQDDIKIVLGQLRKILKKGKLLILSECDQPTWQFNRIHGHRVYHTYNHDWSSLLKEFNFEILDRGYQNDVSYIKCVKNG